MRKMGLNRHTETGIQVVLWIITIVCTYNILTTYDASVFGMSGFIGMFSTWLLIRWDKINEE